MMQELQMSDCFGKRLTNFVVGVENQAVLVFDDGTFAVVSADGRNYDDGGRTDADMYTGRPLNMYTFGDSILAEAGIISAEEIAAKRAEKRAADQAKRDHETLVRERHEWERLRRKHGWTA